VDSVNSFWRMAPASLEATIAVGQKSGVEVQDEELTSLPESVTVPPFSVSIYSFPLQ
jgi:alpha-L-arabinofuranosidase